jgi:hypothetical protein
LGVGRGDVQWNRTWGQTTIGGLGLKMIKD